VILGLIVAAVLVGGCVREGEVDCGDELYRIRLSFSYTLNETGRDDLAAAIHDIRVYVYDNATGILYGVFRASPEDIARGYMFVDLPAGIYTIVAWGSGGSDLFQNGMEEGQVVPPVPPVDPPITPPVDPPVTPPVDTMPVTPTPPPDLKPVKPGETTIDNSHMGLDTNPGTGGTNVPKNPQFDEVFHDSSEDVISRPGRDTEFDDVEMGFNSMSSLVNVRLRGLEYLPATINRPLHVFIEGRNGSLTPAGNVSPDAPSMHYEPYDQASNEREMDVRIQTLKLQMNMEQTQPMMLHIQDRVTGRDIVAPMNLITLIRNVRDAGGNYVYRTQADIDRENEFRILLDLTPDGGIRVSLNDFVIEMLFPILWTW
jgi:hypothetical protein